jgi:hypothetical protein
MSLEKQALQAYSACPIFKRISVPLVVVPLLAVLVLGCGSQSYEARLQETNRYFKYREKLDKALEKRAFDQLGVVLRIPKGFTEIPGPSAEDDADHDPRQPTFFRNDLPGLIAAWQKNAVPVQEDDESVTDRPAWIFLCTNHQRWIDRTSDAKVAPEELQPDVAATLARELRSYGEDSVATWEYADERVPRQSQKAYVPRKDYSWIMLDDTIRIDGEPVEMEVMLNLYSNGPMQLALICVTPKNLGRRDLFYGPIKLSMETLQMTGEAPRPQSDGPKSEGGF